ncbi:MAG: D-alanyl-D-alanine carboxypeptidase [Firmicutes bacterium]|nr:D-alanyl-D-alanine carboxypeptidase [Bacillota bacterium]
MQKINKVLIAGASIIMALLIVTGFTARYYVGANALVDADASNLRVAGRSALLMDHDTGTVVFEQNADERHPIASMVKIMTLNLVFDEMRNGNLTADCDVQISQHAASMGGSQAFMDAGSSYKVGELIKSIVVASANDACVALAEHISGDAQLFVDKMNERAKALGMENTNFANCTGLPSPNGYSTARDVAKMTQEMIRHPEFFEYSTIWMFDFAHPSGRTTELANTNKLVRFYEGCDGGKTGFTNESKYCLSATAKRGNTRLISVVIGAETSKIRNAENSKLFNYGFANYETKRLVEQGAIVEGEFAVKNGKTKTVQVMPEKDFFHFAKRNQKSEFTFENIVDSLKAPLEKGQIVGTMRIMNGGTEIGTINLITTDAILKAGYLDILNDIISQWN